MESKVKEQSSKEFVIKKISFSEMKSHVHNFFVEQSGGKRIIILKRVIKYGGILFLSLALVMAWLGPKEDNTYYAQSSESFDDDSADIEVAGVVSGAIASLLFSGKKKLSDEKAREAARNRRRNVIKYSAPQIIGKKPNVQPAMKSGTKLVGFLMTAIDTRAATPVRVRVVRGGQFEDVVIERGSVLTGDFSYSGEGSKIYLSFSRLDTPDGEAKSILAQALDLGTYTAGIKGETHSTQGTKQAARLGLTMFSGMADVMTEKESLGSSLNGVQAKSNMKNALLQGLSRSAQDQSEKMAEKVESEQDYLTVPEGKEMIIELTEEYK